MFPFSSWRCYQNFTTKLQQNSKTQTSSGCQSSPQYGCDFVSSLSHRNMIISQHWDSFLVQEAALTGYGLGGGGWWDGGGGGGRVLQWSPCPPSLLIDAHQWLLLCLFLPPPSFSSVVRWFHTKVILNIPLILSNLWEILRKTARRQIITKFLNWPAAFIEQKKVTARIKRWVLHKSLLFLSGASFFFFPEEFFHAAWLGEVFRSLSFFTFFRGAPCVGREENICRLIVYCVWLSQGAGISLTHSIQSCFQPQSAHWKIAFLLTAEIWANMFVFCVAQFIPGSSSSSVAPQGEFNSCRDCRQTRRQAHNSDFEEYTQLPQSGLDLCITQRWDKFSCCSSAKKSRAGLLVSSKTGKNKFKEINEKILELLEGHK